MHIVIVWLLLTVPQIPGQKVELKGQFATRDECGDQIVQEIFVDHSVWHQCVAIEMTVPNSK